MEYDWLEIKRFLKDYKNIITIGSFLGAMFFTITMIYIDMNSVEEVQEAVQEDVEYVEAEVMNGAQPAYFQFYLESEDGLAYGNSGIFNQYFNLKSLKEEAQQITNVNIEEVEKEISLRELDDDIKIINVTKNDSSYLFTASFNLGNERNNLKIAEYYFDILINDKIRLLDDKNIYIFTEPVLSKNTYEEVELDDLKVSLDHEKKITKNNIMKQIKNIILGFILGSILVLGLVLLKEIFGETLNYSFGYEIAGKHKFLLLDESLDNLDLTRQFIAVPFTTGKVVLSEKPVDPLIKKMLTKNNLLTFNDKKNGEVMLREMSTLSNMTREMYIKELIILINPGKTTRKWYQKEQKFAEINNFPTKIIQINRKTEK